jgi:hypothetical protein
MNSLTRKERKILEQYCYALTALCYTGKYSYYTSVNQKYLINKRNARLIQKEWNIEDAESMKRQLNWLLDEGRRLEFSQMKNVLKSIPESERSRYIEELPMEDETRFKLSFTHYYLNRLPEENISAIDYSFCIFLSRHGKRLGFLTHEECWTFMMKAARLAQESYSNWMEYITAHTIGIQFTYGNQAAALNYIEELQPAIKKFIASRHSPFHKLKWDTKI